MELGFNARDEAFRTMVSTWIEQHLPDQVRVARPGDILPGGGAGGLPTWSRDWQALLFDNGWLCPGWPSGLGGRNATPQQTLMVYEELARRHAPRTLNFQGLNIVGPSLREFGTPEQNERWLVPTLRGELVWCIGMSEPGAGSDLGGLRTRGVIEGDSVRITGQKVWTSTAHLADWCLVYCRTDADAPKHRGISVIAVDLRAGVDAGTIEIRPFPHITGHLDFAEVFFTEAVVPMDNLIGTLHDGWSVTMASLAHEREGIWVEGVAMVEAAATELIDLARETGRLGDPLVRHRLATVHEQVWTLKCLGYKGFASFAQQSAAPENSLLKLAQAELYQSISELGTLLLGPLGPVMDSAEHAGSGRWAQRYLASFAATIAGGTSEIQRNIIAERVLGLPRAGARR
jgi:alkylation response protein AidB-like acyl-CoA dehydrogenase